MDTMLGTKQIMIPQGETFKLTKIFVPVFTIRDVQVGSASLVRLRIIEQNLLEVFDMLIHLSLTVP